MLKRWIFFLSYVIVFTAVPFCVYHSWSAENSGVKDNSQVIITNGTSGDSLANVMMSRNLAAISNMYANTERSVNTSYAALICLGISMLFGLVLSIVRLAVPELKFGGLIVAITAYNILYLPLIFAGMMSGLTGYSGTGYYAFGLLVYSIPGLVILGMITLVFMLTIILAFQGMNKASRKKIISATPQNPPPSAHPRS